MNSMMVIVVCLRYDFVTHGHGAYPCGLGMWCLGNFKVYNTRSTLSQRTDQAICFIHHWTFAYGDIAKSSRCSRDPPPSPAVVPRFSTPPQIIFHHPAYRSTRLIDLPAFDGNEACPGLHHGTALLICSIIADNKFDGWLSRTRNGEKLDLGSDGLLPVGEYFFHVPWPAGPDTEERQGPYKYPVVPTFRHWTFPHNNLPPASSRKIAPSTIYSAVERLPSSQGA